MFRVYWAEMRSAWSVWLGVSLTFIVTNFAAASCWLMTNSTDVAGERGLIPKDYVTELRSVLIANQVLIVLTALSVIGSTTSLVVASRRGQLARLALAGASPRQIVRSLMLQLVVVSLVCALIGDAIAVVSQQRLFAVFVKERSEDLAVPGVVFSLTAILTSSLACVLIAVVGGFRQARIASKIPPVEALREANAGAKQRGVLRWIGAGLIAAGIVGAFVMAPSALVKSESGLQLTFQVGMMLIPLTGLAFGLAAPMTIGWVTRLWTAAVPVPSATWLLARNTVTSKGERFAKSVVPVMMAVGMVLGILLVGNSLVALLETMGNHDMGHGSITTVLVLLGFAFAISASGSVGNLFMMSRQRDAELALEGIIGATPAQRRVVPMLEALIVVVTGTVLAVVMAAVGAGFIEIVMQKMGLHYRTIVPWGSFAAATGISLLIAVATTTLPSLRSINQPAPRVIARLVAE